MGTVRIPALSMVPSTAKVDAEGFYINSQNTAGGKTNRYYPPDVSAMVAADRLAASSAGQPVNPSNTYHGSNPFVLAALTAQQNRNPVEITVAGGNPAIYPAWVSRAKGDFYSGRAPANMPMLPVNTMTPELQTAYADRTPAGRKKLAYLLADAAQAGNIGKAPVKASGGLASLITGKGTPRASGGLFGLLFGGGASKPAAAPYGGRYTPQQLADRESQGQAIAQANRQNPNPTYTVSGDNNSFMPRSVQESVRWQTGY